jgi:hypothetical protein
MRTIRAALPIALTWGIAWGLVGAMIGMVGFIRNIPLGRATFGLFLGIVVTPAALLCATGILSGLLFAAALRWMEQGRTLDTFSGWRAAGWGAVAVFVFSQLIVGLIALTFGLSDALDFSVLRLTGVAAVCGAISAAASLAIARKGTPGLLEEAAEVQRLRASVPGTP